MTTTERSWLSFITGEEGCEGLEGAGCDNPAVAAMATWAIASVRALEHASGKYDPGPASSVLLVIFDAIEEGALSLEEVPDFMSRLDRCRFYGESLDPVGILATGKGGAPASWAFA